MLFFPSLLGVNWGCMLMERLPCWKSWEMHKEIGDYRKGKGRFHGSENWALSWVTEFYPCLCHRPPVWYQTGDITFHMWWLSVFASFSKVLYLRHSEVRNDHSCKQVLTLKHGSTGVIRKEVTGTPSEPRVILGNGWISFIKLSQCKLSVCLTRWGKTFILKNVWKWLKFGRVTSNPPQSLPEENTGK